MEFKYESVNNTILNMLYLPNQIEIECDFVLTNEDTIFKGKSKIMRGEEYIEIKGSLIDYITSVTKNSNVIYMSDIPSEYECNLSNLPKKNMKKDIIDMDINIKFPRVKISPNIDITMSYDTSNLIGNIHPLYDYKSRDIMILSCD